MTSFPHNLRQFGVEIDDGKLGVGNTGKSSFARAYICQEPTDGILLKIDNLDRMELSLIEKIRNYRDRYNQDPKIIFLDFPRAVDGKKVMAAKALMEDAKSGHLETSFGGKHRQVQISKVHVVVLSNNAPDLSVLSVDRWRLGGHKFKNVIWPCKAVACLKGYESKSKLVKWTVVLNNIAPLDLMNMGQYKSLNLKNEWYSALSNDRETFGSEVQYTKNVINSLFDVPNEIRLKVIAILNKKGLLIE